MGERRGLVGRAAVASALWVLPRGPVGWDGILGFGRRVLPGAVAEIRATRGRAGLVLLWLLAALALLNLFGLAVELLVPGAHAALSGEAALGGVKLVAPDALPIRWIKDIFGAPLSILSGSTKASSGSAITTVVPKVLGFLNGAVLGAAGLLLLWSIVDFVYRMAHSGETADKHDRWAPIRIPVAVAALVPVSGGFSAVQLLVLLLAVQGSDLAERGWRLAVDKMVETAQDGDGASLTTAGVPEPEAVARAVLQGYACVEALRIQGIQAKQNVIPHNASTVQTIGKQQATIKESLTTVQWGGADGTGVSPTACGAVTWVDKVELGAGVGKSVREDAKAMAAFALRKSASEAQAKALAVLAADLQPLGRRAALVTAPDKVAVPPQPAEIIAAVDRYRAAVAQSITVAVTSADKALSTAWTDEAKASGWVYAATWWSTIANAQAAVLSLAKRQPEVSASPNYKGIPDTAIPIISAAVGAADDAWKAAHVSKGAPDPGIVARAQAGAMGQYGKDSDAAQTADEWDTKIGGWIGAAVRPYLQAVRPDSINPIADMSRMGHMQMQAAVLCWFAPLPFAAIPFAGNAISYASTGITALAGLLGISGATLAIYLPMLPFVTFAFGVLGWLSAVLEGVIGATVWALALTSLQGTGLGGRGGQGVMLLVVIVLQPILMLFGLLVSIAAMVPISNYIGGGMQALSGAIAPDSVVGVSAMIAFNVAYTGVMVLSAHFCIGFFNQILNGILKWIGATAAPGVSSAEVKGAVNGERPGGGGGGGKRGGGDGDRDRQQHEPNGVRPSGSTAQLNPSTTSSGEKQ